MSSQAEARVFISYSVKDATAFASELRRTLLKEGLTIWQDIIALEGGRDWWSQIEEAVRSKWLQHFVLIVSPAALDSPIVRQEIRLARQEGKNVLPIKGPGISDVSRLPRWLGQIYDLDLPEHVDTFIRVLSEQSRQKRVPMMAPEPPRDFVARPREFAKLKRDLLDAKGDAVAITAALRGAGGYGKTTLAKALAHDPDIQDAYFDGVLWVELGESPGSLLSVLSDLVEILTGERPGMETIQAAAAKLAEALSDRRSLLIIDDVWREQDLAPLLQGGIRTTRLITTRNDTVLPDRASRHVVDAMEGREALKLLTVGLTLKDVVVENIRLAALATRLGEWPLLLKIVNGFLRDRVSKRQQPLSAAIVDVNKRLEARGLIAFDAKDATERSKAVARTIGVSLELLDDSERARFTRLGIFPEDAEIPLDIVHRNWLESVDYDETEAEDFIERLHDLSLLLDLDLNRRLLRLHDTIRHFLRDEAGSEFLARQHRHLLLAMDHIEAPETDMHARRYFYLYFLLHLAEAGDRTRLDSLLLDPAWLQAKLIATSPQALVVDFALYGNSQVHRQVERTLRLITGICSRDPQQLIPQLLGRLMAVDDVAMKRFLDVARMSLRVPAILTLKPSLTPPIVETARIEVRGGRINVLCALPDHRLAAGFEDGIIRLWDLASGTEIGRLVGHASTVNALSMMRDGRLASCSDDGTMRLWDLTDRVQTASTGKISSTILTLCALPSGHLASGFPDGTVRLWDPTNLIVAAILDWHTESVMALCALPDGRLASASVDRSVRLWDPASGEEIEHLTGHKSSVHALCALPDGLLGSASSDDTIRLWSSRTGRETACFFSGYVAAMCGMPSGRLASGASDGKIRIWDTVKKAETARLEGHTARVNALIALPDGQLVSSAADDTIRLWDPASTSEVGNTELHTDAINALCVLPDGRVVSASDDGTIRLWLPDGRVEIGTLPNWSRQKITALALLPDGRFACSSEGGIYIWSTVGGLKAYALNTHTRVYSSNVLQLLPDGHLISASSETTHLWDLAKGLVHSFTTGSVTAMCVLPDGRIAAGYFRGALRLWERPHEDADAFDLATDGAPINALCTTPDGRLVSGSTDKMIKLWDSSGCKEIARIRGHTGAVTALCPLSDGRILSGAADNTVRLWDSTTYREITRLEVDVPVKCLALLPDGGFVAGDQAGRVHWLKIVD